MYQNYFGFSVLPFENNLDPRFIFFSANHKEVYAALLYFIKLKKSFAMVCGDVGTGKTMLIHTLLNKLPQTVHPIMIMNPAVGYLDILRYVAGILKVDAKGVPMLELVDRVKDALVAASQRGERFVLIIDEAHLLPDASIEQIRLLSNIETREYKLFQILLLGQYELSYKLDRPEMRQIRQRINVNRFLAPMDAEETIRYIDHRLKMAGSGYDACFEANCKDLIYKMTGGVPRSINQLCDNALLACMAEKKQRVDRKTLKTAGTVIKSDILFTPGKHAAGTRRSGRPLGILEAFGAVFLVLLLLGIAGYWGGMGEGVRRFLQGGYLQVESAGDLSAKRTENVSGADAPLMHHPRNDGNTTSKAVPPLTTPILQPVPEKSSVLPSPEAPPPAEVPPLKKDAEPLSRALERPPEPISPQLPSVEKTLPPENPSDGTPQTDGTPHAKRIMIKSGDTLMDIASRYYPEDKAGGLRKILSANPFISNVNWIYTGQELVLPGVVPDREGSNR